MLQAHNLGLLQPGTFVRFMNEELDGIAESFRTGRAPMPRTAWEILSGAYRGATIVVDPMVPRNTMYMMGSQYILPPELANMESLKPSSGLCPAQREKALKKALEVINGFRNDL